MNQKGFATLEVILMVVVIGILATIAVPRFERITAQANTSKVVSDLAAINSAAAVYQMENNATPPSYDVLKDYLENGLPQPPSGKVYINGTITPIDSSNKYSINSSGKATFADKTAEQFTTTKTTATSGG